MAEFTKETPHQFDAKMDERQLICEVWLYVIGAWYPGPAYAPGADISNERGLHEGHKSCGVASCLIDMETGAEVEIYLGEGDRAIDPDHTKRTGLQFKYTTEEELGQFMRPRSDVAKAVVDRLMTKPILDDGHEPLPTLVVK